MVTVVLHPPSPSATAPPAIMRTAPVLSGTAVFPSHTSAPTPITPRRHLALVRRPWRLPQKIRRSRHGESHVLSRNPMDPQTRCGSKPATRDRSPAELKRTRPSTARTAAPACNNGWPRPRPRSICRSFQVTRARSRLAACSAWQSKPCSGTNRQSASSQRPKPKALGTVRKQHFRAWVGKNALHDTVRPRLQHFSKVLLGSLDFTAIIIRFT